MGQALTEETRKIGNGMSFTERVKSWGKTPEIAHARAPTPPHVACKTTSLQCRDGQDSKFDLAVIDMPDKEEVQLKNATAKIDCRIPLSVLMKSSTDGQANWVLVEVGDRKISIKRKSIETALRKFGIIT